MILATKKIDGMWSAVSVASGIKQLTCASRKTVSEFVERWNNTMAPLPAHEQLNSSIGKSVWRKREGK